MRHLKTLVLVALGASACALAVSARAEGPVVAAAAVPAGNPPGNPPSSQLGNALGNALGKLPAEPFVKRAPEPSSFRCDGTDPFFFDEIEKAGDLGYGETWDESLCDEGVSLYAEGATSRWRALRAPKRPLQASKEDQMLALVMPMFVIGGLGAIFLAAGAVAGLSRMKKRTILEVPCPACAASLPIPVDDKSEHTLFCPMCGAACGVDVQGRGKQATAAARLLA